MAMRTPSRSSRSGRSAPIRSFGALLVHRLVARRIRPLLSIAAALAATVALAPGAAAAASATDEILLQRAPGASASEVADARREAGVRLVDRPLPGIDRVEVVHGDRARALERLRRDPDIAWAEPARVTRALDEPVPDDPYLRFQWGLMNPGGLLPGSSYPLTAGADIRAVQLWPLATGVGSLVAVADSGVQRHHGELDGRVEQGLDFLAPGGPVPDSGDDPHGHGTAVSTVLAAAMDGAGMVGVAPDAHVLPLRVLDEEGEGSTAGTAAAFGQAADDGVRVVNASLGATGFTYAEWLAIARNPDTLYVVAAGNDGEDLDSGGTPTYPCMYGLPNVLCVGASTGQDKPAGFSNFGRYSVDLFAPGERVVASLPHEPGDDPGFWYLDGTSLATPMVAATAALIAAARPDLTPLQVKRIMMGAVDHVEELADLSVSGGRLNAARALQSATSDELDLDPPASPGEVRATLGSGSVTLDWDPVADSDVAGYVLHLDVPGEGWLPLTDVLEESSVNVLGLAPGKTYRFRVIAVDQTGNESAGSAERTVTMPVPPPPPSPPPAPGPPRPAPPRPAPIVPDPVTRPSELEGGEKVEVDPEDEKRRKAKAKVVGLRIVGKASSRSTSSAKLEIRLSAPAKVKISARRRVCKGKRCRYGNARSKTLSLRAGRQRIKLDGRTVGTRLTRGTWRFTVVAPGGSRSVTLRVR